MAEWPDDPQSLAKVWSRVAHGTRIAELCSRSLVPVTQRGLTVFYTLTKEPTELTCSLKYKPSGKTIDSARLVSIAVISLFMTMSPVAALAYCKGKWSSEPSLFWAKVRVVLAPAIDMPPTISEASRIENPNVRNFVLRCWYRLRTRLGIQETEKVLRAATTRQWPNGDWTPLLCKWMKQLQTPLVISTQSKADLFVGRVPVAIPYRDKVALSLMILFREPLAYGERRMTTELAKATQFDIATALFNPQPCPLHLAIRLAMKFRTRFVEDA